MNLEDKLILASINGNISTVEKILESNAPVNVNATMHPYTDYKFIGVEVRWAHGNFGQNYSSASSKGITHKQTIDKNYNVKLEYNTDNKLLHCLGVDLDDAPVASYVSNRKSSTWSLQQEVSFNVWKMHADWELVRTYIINNTYSKVYKKKRLHQAVDALQAAVMGNHIPVASILLNHPDINFQGTCKVRLKYKFLGSDKFYVKFTTFNNLELALVLGRHEIVGLIFGSLQEPGQTLYNLVTTADASILKALEIYEHAKFIIPKIHNINHKYTNGETLLHAVIKKGCYKLADYLIANAGADTTIVANDGKVALELCRDPLMHENLVAKIKSCRKDGLLFSSSSGAKAGVNKKTNNTSDSDAHSYLLADPARGTSSHYMQRLFSRVPELPVATPVMPQEDLEESSASNQPKLELA